METSASVTSRPDFVHSIIDIGDAWEGFRIIVAGAAPFTVIWLKSLRMVLPVSTLSYFFTKSIASQLLPQLEKQVPTKAPSSFWTT